MVSQEVKRGAAKLALGRVDEEPVLAQQKEKTTESHKMFLHGGGVGQVVIQIGEDGFFRLEDLVHQSLKGLSGITEPKRHVYIFKQAEGCNNGRLRDVRGAYWNLVVAFYKVYLGEYCRAM
jgi:hypothetical protein